MITWSSPTNYRIIQIILQYNLMSNMWELIHKVNLFLPITLCTFNIKITEIKEGNKKKMDLTEHL